MPGGAPAPSVFLLDPEPKIPALDIVLSAGDSLFIPAGWFHQVGYALSFSPALPTTLLGDCAVSVRFTPNTSLFNSATCGTADIIGSNGRREPSHSHQPLAASTVVCGVVSCPTCPITQTDSVALTRPPKLDSHGSRHAGYSHVGSAVCIVLRQWCVLVSSRMDAE